MAVFYDDSLTVSPVLETQPVFEFSISFYVYIGLFDTTNITASCRDIPHHRSNWCVILLCYISLSLWICLNDLQQKLLQIHRYNLHKRICFFTMYHLMPDTSLGKVFNYFKRTSLKLLQTTHKWATAEKINTQNYLTHNTVQRVQQSGLCIIGPSTLLIGGWKNLQQWKFRTPLLFCGKK